MSQVTHVVVDVESDGPCPSLYSMVEFGAVVVEPELNRYFHGKCFPVGEERDSKVLAISGHTYDELDEWPRPEITMGIFTAWLYELPGKPMFWSDNPAFDWQWINYYFHVYCGGNPFGFSGRDIGALYKGCERSLFKNFKHLRKTKHTHNPVDDAMGNAEAMLAIKEQYDVKGI